MTKPLLTGQQIPATYHIYPYPGCFFSDRSVSPLLSFLYFCWSLSGASLIPSNPLITTDLPPEPIYKLEEILLQRITLVPHHHKICCQSLVWATQPHADHTLPSHFIHKLYPSSIQDETEGGDENGDEIGELGWEQGWDRQVGTVGWLFRLCIISCLSAYEVLETQSNFTNHWCIK